MARAERNRETEKQLVRNGRGSADVDLKRDALRFFILGSIWGPIVAHFCGGMPLACLVAGLFLVVVLLVLRVIFFRTWPAYRLRRFAIWVWASAFASTAAFDAWVWPALIEAVNQLFGIRLPAGEPLCVKAVMFIVFGIGLAALCRMGKD